MHKCQRHSWSDNTESDSNSEVELQMIMTIRKNVVTPAQLRKPTIRTVRGTQLGY